MFNFFIKKKTNDLLSSEDMNKLKKIERDAYIKEAEKLAINVGIERAKKDYKTSDEKHLSWQ